MINQRMALSFHYISGLPIPELVGDAVRRIKQQNAECYVVGGAVRDLLCERAVNDYDIVTTLDLKTVSELFPQAKTNFSAREGLAWKEGEVQFEVASLGQGDSRPAKDKGRSKFDIDNILSFDARGRDFTVNTLYLDIERSVIIDPLSALNDIENAAIRCVTDADANIRNNPLHMLRAIRFARKLDFTIEAGLQVAIRRNAHLITEESPGRTLVEIYRHIVSGHSMQCLRDVCSQGLHIYTFPRLAENLASERLNLLQFFLHSLDRGFIDHSVCNRGFVFAALIWEDIFTLLDKEVEWSETAILSALHTALSRQADTLNCRKMLWDYIYPILIWQKSKESRTASLCISYSTSTNFSLLRGTAQAAGVAC